MKRLLELELIKLKHSKSAKVISIIYILFTILILIIISEEKDSGIASLVGSEAPFGFPEIWLTGTWLSSWLVFFPVMMSVLNVGGEFTQKMHRQHIIDGLTRKEYVLSKFLNVFIISTVFTLYTFFLCLLTGMLIGGDGAEVENNFFLYIIGYFLYTFSILCFAVLVTFLLKKTGRSIFALIGYYLILENVIWYFAKDTFIPKYLPLLSISNNLLPNWRGEMAKHGDKFWSIEPGISMFNWNAALLAIIYIGIYFLITRWLFLRRDL